MGFNSIKVQYMNHKVSVNQCTSLERTADSQQSINEKLRKRKMYDFSIEERLTATCLIQGRDVLPVPMLVSAL